MMKILMVTSEYPPYGSGIANAVYIIRKYLQSEGIKVTVLSKKGADINIERKIYQLPGLAGLTFFWQDALKFITKRCENYDVIWLHSPIVASIPKEMNSVRKLMITFHSTYYGHYEGVIRHNIHHLTNYYHIASTIERSFLQRISLLEDIVVTAVSPSVRKELIKNGLKIPVHVIPNGIITDQIKRIDKQSMLKFLEQTYSIILSDKERILLYVGRLTPIKQPLKLIDLFLKLSSINPKIHLLIAGTGELKRKIEKIARQHNNIHITGQIPHHKVLALLEKADAFVSLSGYEGLPLSVLEAASFNLPLILSDIPAHRWIIESQIGYGVLVNLRNPNLTEINDFIQNVNQITSAKRMYSPFRKCFTWENVVKQYLKLLTSF